MGKVYTVALLVLLMVSAFPLAPRAEAEVTPGPDCFNALTSCTTNQWIHALFPVDHNKTVSGLDSPIDRLSRKTHELEVDSLERVQIHAIGVQRSDHVFPNEITASTDWRFHTMHPDVVNASITNRKLGADGSSGAEGIVLCQQRLTQSGVPHDCTGLTFRARLVAAPFVSLDHVNEESLAAEGALPSFNPSAGESLVATPLSQVAWNTQRQNGPWADGELDSVGSFSVVSFAFSSVQFTDWQRLVYDPPIGPDRRASYSPVVFLEVEIKKNDVLVGGVAEPVWRTYHAAGGAQDPTLRMAYVPHFCSRGWPGAASIDAYAQGQETPLAFAARDWHNSCVPVADGKAIIPWVDLLADDSWRQAFQDAWAAPDTLAGLQILGAQVNASLAYGIPARSLFTGMNPSPPGCLLTNGVKPCLRLVVGTMNPMASVTTIEVYDNGTWKEPDNLTKVYGGPTRLRISLEGFWDSAGQRVTYDETGSTTPDEFTLELSSAASTLSVQSAGVRLQRAGRDFDGGTVVVAPEENAIRPGLESAIPAVVPFLNISASTAVPLHLDWLAEEPASGPAQACAELAWSYNADGALPNFLLQGSPASRLAVSAPGDTAWSTCFALADLIRVRMPGTNELGTVLEVREGTGFSLALEVPGVNGPSDLAAWADGDDVRTERKAHLSQLVGNDFAENPAGALLEINHSQAKSIIPRVIVSVPADLPPEVVVDTAMLLAWSIRDSLLGAFLEFEDAPATPLASAVLRELEIIALEQGGPRPPFFIGTGTLPPGRCEDHPYRKALTISGLAAEPEFITVGPGTVAGGVDPCARLGPSPALRMKPDFLAPSLPGNSAVAVMNIVPVVELFLYAGVVGDDAIRAGLAGVARPVNTSLLHTPYMQGLGVLDPEWLVLSALEEGANQLPSPLAVRAAAAIALSQEPYALWPAAPPQVQLSELPSPRARTTAAWANGAAYIFGGVGPDEPLSDDIFRFDPATQTIEELSVKLPSPRKYAAAASHDDKIYVIGGTTITESLDEVLLFDPENETVEQVATMPVRASLPTVIEYVDVLYVLGADGGKIVRFDPADGTSLLAQSTLGNVHAATTNGNYIHAFSTSTHVKRFDPVLDDVEILDGEVGGYYYLTAFSTGRDSYLFGAYNQNPELASDVLRFNSDLGTVTTYGQGVLPAPAVKPAIAWSGRHAYLIGGGTETDPYDRIMSFVPESHGLGPATVPENLEAVAAFAQTNATRSAVLGLSIPAGALDPIQWGRVPQFHVDVPIMPGTPFTDWGVTDHEVSRPAKLKLVDAEQTSNASANPVRDLAQNSGLLLPYGLLPEDIVNLTTVDGRLTRPSPNVIDVNTTHYWLFDMFRNDTVHSLHRSLIDSMFGGPTDVPVDVAKTFANGSAGYLAKPYFLVDNLTWTSGGAALATSAEPCLDISDVADFARNVTTFVNGLASSLLAVPSTGMVSVTPNLTTLETLAAVGNSDLANGVQCLAGIVATLEALDARALWLSQLRADAALLETDVTWADGSGVPLSDQDLLTILTSTATVLGYEDLETDTLAATNSTLDALALAVNDVQAHLVDAVGRAALNTGGSADNPTFDLWSRVDRTEQAPLGPYVGITTITTRDVQMVDPFSGATVGTRDVTIPIPSLLWNNPILHPVAMYRDGTVSPGSGMALGNPFFKVFNEAFNATIVVDGVQVPLFYDLDATVPDTFDPLLRRSTIEDNVAVAVAALDEATSRAMNGSVQEDQDEYTMTLARKALESVHVDCASSHAASTLPVVCESGDVGAALTALYSKPLSMSNRSGDDGAMRFGRLFPVQQVSRTWEIHYGGLRELSEFSDYKGALDGRTLSPLDDIDSTTHALIRDLVVGEDAPASPTEAPRWPHDPREPLPLPVEAGSPVEYDYGVIEYHGDGIGPFHQFNLTQTGGANLSRLACLVQKVHADRYATGVGLGHGCEGSAAAPIMPSFSAIAANMCSFVAAGMPCSQGISEGVGAGASLSDQVDACAAHTDRQTCLALLKASATVDSLLSMIAGPTQSTAQVPLLWSVTRTLVEVPSLLGLEQGPLTAAIADWNGITEAAASTVAAKVLVSLGDFINQTVEVEEPPRHDVYDMIFAQGLISHGGDRVSGLDWTVVTGPPRIDELGSFTDVLNLTMAARMRLEDSSARAWTSSVLTVWNATTPATLAARIVPPLASELLERHEGRYGDSAPLRVPALAQAPVDSGLGIPVLGYSEGGSSVPWLSTRGFQAASLDAQPNTTTTFTDLSAIEEFLAGALALSLGELDAGTLVQHASREGAQWSSWSSEVGAANQLLVFFEADPDPQNVSSDDLDNVVRAMLTQFSDATSWAIDRSLDALRATTSVAAAPKVGFAAYSIPLAPQETVSLALDGNYYFQNTDAVLVVTPHDVVRDTVLALGTNLTSILETTSDPVARVEQILGEITFAVSAEMEGDGGFVHSGKPYVRVRHLNPATQAEIDEGQDNNSSERDVIVRYGRLRNQSATDSFGFETKPIKESGQFGFDEVHLVYVFFPTADSSVAAELGEWVQDLEGLPQPPDPEEALLEQEAKFIISDFGVMWDTYVGFAPSGGVHRGGIGLGFPNPWRPSVEDLKLQWAVPAASWFADQTDFSNMSFRAASEHAIYTEDDVPFIQNSVLVPDDAPSEGCPDFATAGNWYTPKGSRPQGVASGDANGARSGEYTCSETAIEGLQPSSVGAAENGSFPVRYRARGGGPNGALQYDVNTPATSYEAVWYAERLGGASDQLSALAAQGGDTRSAVLSDLLAVLDLYPASFWANEEAVSSLLRENPGLLAQVRILLDGTGESAPVQSYVPATADGGGGIGPTQHHWAVLDEVALGTLANWNDGRPPLTVADRENYTRAKPYDGAVLEGVGRNTTHEWFGFSQDFDPARIVIGIGTDVLEQGNGGFLFVNVTVLDGFQGRGYAFSLGGSVPSGAMPSNDDGGTFPANFANLFTLTTFEMGTALGGTAEYTANGTERIRLTPPGDCWEFPNAERILLHATCYRGEWSSDGFGGQITPGGVRTNCIGHRDLVSAATVGMSNPFITGSGRNNAYSTTRLWPLHVELYGSGTATPDRLAKYLALRPEGVVEAANSLVSCPYLQDQLAGEGLELALVSGSIVHEPVPNACTSSDLEALDDCRAVHMSDHLNALNVDVDPYFLPLAFNVDSDGPRHVTAAPTNNAATEEVNSIEVDWKAPPGYFLRYEIQYGQGSNLGPTEEIDRAATRMVRSGLAPYVSYTVKIRSAGPDGASPWIERQAIASSVPSEPASLQNSIACSVVNPSNTNPDVTLTWTAPAGDGGSAITAYKVYRRVTGGPSWDLRTQTSALTYTDMNVGNSITYDYKVVGLNQWGEGLPKTITLSTPGPTCAI